MSSQEVPGALRSSQELSTMIFAVRLTVFMLPCVIGDASMILDLLSVPLDWQRRISLGQSRMTLLFRRTELR